MANVKCPSCGSSNVEHIDTDKYQCPYCGKTFSSRESLQDVPVNSNQVLVSEDKPTFLMNLLSFLIPVGGIILYFVKKAKTPISAKSYLKWGLIGLAVTIVFEIIYAFLIEY